jgi:hypothetical protein
MSARLLLIPTDIGNGNPDKSRGPSPLLSFTFVPVNVALGSCHPFHPFWISPSDTPFSSSLAPSPLGAGPAGLSPKAIGTPWKAKAPFQPFHGSHNRSLSVVSAPRMVSWIKSVELANWGRWGEGGFPPIPQNETAASWGGQEETHRRSGLGQSWV